MANSVLLLPSARKNVHARKDKLRKRRRRLNVSSKALRLQVSPLPSWWLPTTRMASRKALIFTILNSRYAELGEAFSSS